MNLPASADVLAISPHLDDAVLGAGGCIAGLTAAGRRVTIYTVFAGDPPARPFSPAARLLHRACGLGAAPVAQRRAEDREAAGELRADIRHGTFPDAVYRTGPDGGWLIDPRTGPADSALDPEKYLVIAVAAAVSEVVALLRPRLILTCASFGGHVDHRHTVTAVRAAAEAAGLPVRLWTDLPYVTEPVTEFPAALRESFGPHRAEPHRVVAEAWSRKLTSVSRYRSQLPMLWPRVDDVPALLDAQAREWGRAFGGIGPCELFWRPDEPVSGRPDPD